MPLPDNAGFDPAYSLESGDSLTPKDESTIETLLGKELYIYLEQNIMPKYNHPKIDRGHRSTHIRRNLSNILQLTAMDGISANDTKLAIIATYYHDIGLMTGDRENHHLHSKSYILKDTKLAQLIPANDLEIVAQAAFNHRASGEEPLDGLVSKYVSDADREFDFAATIYRSYNFALAHGDTPEQAIQHVIKHMKEKYGCEGYAKLYTPAAIKLYANKRKKFDNVTKAQVEEIISSGNIHFENADHTRINDLINSVAKRAIDLCKKHGVRVSEAVDDKLLHNVMGKFTYNFRRVYLSDLKSGLNYVDSEAAKKMHKAYNELKTTLTDNRYLEITTRIVQSLTEGGLLAIYIYHNSDKRVLNSNKPTTESVNVDKPYVAQGIFYNPSTKKLAAISSGKDNIGLPGGKIIGNESITELLIKECLDQGWVVTISDKNPVNIDTVGGEVYHWYKLDTAELSNNDRTRKSVEPMWIDIEKLANSWEPYRFLTEYLNTSTESVDVEAWYAKKQITFEGAPMTDNELDRLYPIRKATPIPIFEDTETELQAVMSIISTMTSVEQKYTGSRGKYDKSVIRVIKYDKATPAAYCEIFIGSAKEVGFVNIGSSPAFRGKGYAKSAFSEAKKKASAKHIQTLNWNASLKNTPSQVMAEKLGFKKAKTQSSPDEVQYTMYIGTAMEGFSFEDDLDDKLGKLGDRQDGSDTSTDSLSSGKTPEENPPDDGEGSDATPDDDGMGDPMSDSDGGMGDGSDGGGEEEAPAADGSDTGSQPPNKRIVYAEYVKLDGIIQKTIENIETNEYIINRKGMIAYVNRLRQISEDIGYIMDKSFVKMDHHELLIHYETAKKRVMLIVKLLTQYTSEEQEE